MSASLVLQDKRSVYWCVMQCTMKGVAGQYLAHPVLRAPTEGEAWVVLDPDRACLVPLWNIELSCFCGHLQDRMWPLNKL